MKKFVIKGEARMYFEVEVEANSEEEAKQRVCGMDSNDLEFTGIDIMDHDLEVK